MISLGIDIGGSSIKAACVRDGTLLWTRQSQPYTHPGRADLIGALREMRDQTPAAIGLCVPGLLDRARRMVTMSVNIPALANEPLDAMLIDAFGQPLPKTMLFTDAHASAYDIYSARRLTGRLLLLALGSGVGAAVYDEHGPVCVDDESAGHFGQMDVSVGNVPLIGPDGGAGSLEAYVSSAALRERYGEDWAGQLDAESSAVRALARAIRIGHAIYRPQHICLAGGVGLGFAPLLRPLRDLVARDLTRIARPEWSLTCGDHLYHAAAGAARLACIV